MNTLELAVAKSNRFTVAVQSYAVFLLAYYMYVVERICEGVTREEVSGCSRESCQTDLVELLPIRYP